MAEYLKTKYPGVTYYESKDRNDKCFYITYRNRNNNNKLVREKVGWQSEGYSALQASLIRSERIKEARHGITNTDITLTEGVELFIRDLLPDKCTCTISEAIKKIEDEDKKAYIQKKYQQLTFACNYFGYSIQLSSIKGSMINEYAKHLTQVKSSRKKPLAAQTIHHYYNTLAQMFKFLIDNDKYHGKSPFSDKTRNHLPTINNEIINYLTNEEFNSAISILLEMQNEKLEDQFAANFMLFSLSSGFRKSEVSNLLEENVSLEKNLIFIKNPKSGKDETVEISYYTKNIIISQYELKKKHGLKSNYVFCKSDGTKRKDVRRQFERLKQRAGITKYFRFHDLRHNFATMVLAAGNDLYTIQKLLTHKDPKTTQKYAHFLPGKLGTAVDNAISLVINSSKDNLLPKKMLMGNIIDEAEQVYSQLGFLVEKYNDLYYKVEFPDGWKIEDTTHNLWKTLYYNQELMAMIFEKEGEACIIFEKMAIKKSL